MRSWRNLLLFLAATLLALNVLAQSTKPVVRTITPGVGVDDFRLGGTLAEAEAAFGKPSRTWQRFVHFAPLGIEAVVEDKKVQVLIFHFRSPEHRPFEGVTDKGIGQISSMEDVQKAYGKLEKIDESVVSEFGSNPGAVEHFLRYPKLGIAFNFQNRKLADIRISTPEK